MDAKTIQLAKDHAQERAVIEARAIYVYDHPFEVTEKARTDQQALYVAMPPSQHVAFRMVTRMNERVHYLDMNMYPGGEIVCGRPLSYEQHRTKTTKAPSEVTCASCLYILTLRSK